MQGQSLLMVFGNRSHINVTGDARYDQLGDPKAKGGKDFWILFLVQSFNQKSIRNFCDLKERTSTINN